jgi:hypothetical protein
VADEVSSSSPAVYESGGVEAALITGLSPRYTDSYKLAEGVPIAHIPSPSGVFFTFILLASSF